MTKQVTATRRCCMLFVLAFALFAGVGEASSITYSSPGTYTVPSNCGFAAGSTSGWVRMALANDPSGRSTDLYARAAENYPLVLREIQIFSGGASVTVDTTPSCACSVTLDPFAPLGQCYTRSFGADECETDPNRPEVNDPEAVVPGPDIPFTNVGFYGGGEGDVDWIGILQSDWGYWNTARQRAGEWSLGGIRRCRLVDGSDNSYLTLIAP
jgi:hypothetical protein